MEGGVTWEELLDTSKYEQVVKEYSNGNTGEYTTTLSVTGEGYVPFIIFNAHVENSSHISSELESVVTIDEVSYTVRCNTLNTISSERKSAIVYTISLIDGLVIGEINSVLNSVLKIVPIDYFCSLNRDFKNGNTYTNNFGYGICMAGNALENIDRRYGSGSNYSFNMYQYPLIVLQPSLIKFENNFSIKIKVKNTTTGSATMGMVGHVSFVCFKKIN